MADSEHDPISGRSAHADAGHSGAGLMLLAGPGRRTTLRLRLAGPLAGLSGCPDSDSEHRNVLLLGMASDQEQISWVSFAACF